MASARLSGLERFSLGPSLPPPSGFASSLPPPRMSGTEDVRDLLPKLTQETELQKMLADEKMRSEQHRTNYQTVKAEHTRLQDEYIKLQTELRSTIEESKLVQEKYKTILEDLRSELSEKHKETEELKSQTLTSQRMDMLRLQVRDELDQSYRERYQRMDSDVDRYRAEYNKLKYEYSFVKSEYEHEKVENQRVIEEMKLRHEAEVTNLRKERETLITRQQQENSSDSTRSRSLQRENTQLQVKLKGVLAELEEIRAQKEHSGLQTENVTRLQNKQLVENTINIKALETERASLKLQVSSLQKEMALNNDLQTQLTSRTHELEKDNIQLKNRAEETIHKSKVDLTNLQMEMLKERGELERERDRLRNEIEELKSDIEIQKHAVEQQAEALIEKERDVVKRVQGAREEEWQKLRALQGEKIDLETKLQENERRKIDEEAQRHADHEKMDDKIQQANDARQDAEKELCVVRTKLQHQTSLTESLERERAENSELKSRVHRLETENNGYVSKERDLSDANHTLTRQLEEIRGELQKVREALKTAENDADRVLSQHRATWIEEKSGYQRRIDELEDQMSAQQEQINAVVASHRKKKKAYTNLITKLKHKLTLTQAKMEELTIEREALKKSVPSEAHIKLKKQLQEMMRRHRDYRMLLMTSETNEVNIGNLSFMSAGKQLDASQLSQANYSFGGDNIMDKQHIKELDLLKERLDMLDDNQKHQLQELKGISPIDSPRIDDIEPPRLRESVCPERDNQLVV